jgi:site-specific recombinase XerD
MKDTYVPKLSERSRIPFSRGHCTAPEFAGPVDAFLASLRARKLSEQTVKKRADDLRKLLVYLDAQGMRSFSDVDLKTLETYRFALVDHDYSDSAIESALRAASLFFRFLEERGQLFENPARQLKIRKAPVIMGTVLTECEIKQLLAAPDVTRPRGLRDRAILEVLYSTGLRRGEAVALTTFDVHLNEATINVTGKGRKQRLLPLGKHAVKYLRLYLQEARQSFAPRFSPAPDALWLDRYRKALSAQGITGLVGIYSRKANLGKSVDIHSIRRTCATHMLRGGAHPVAISQLLGHSGLRSLSHYLNTSIADLMQAHAHTKPGQ